MTVRDRNEIGGSPFAELLSQLAQGDPEERSGTRSEISERAETLVANLVDAAGADWPSVDELRQLPTEEFANVSRQLSLVIDQLSALRAELLGGRGRL